MSIAFSIAGNAGQKTIEAEVGRAVLAEELGYEGIFVSEGLTGHDPFQVFALAATRTSRIRLGTAIMTLSGHIDEITDSSFSPDGRSIVTASKDGTVKIWDAKTGQERLTLKGVPTWMW